MTILVSTLVINMFLMVVFLYHNDTLFFTGLILEAFTMPSMTDTEKESVMGLIMSTGMRLRVSFDDYE